MSSGHAHSAPPTGSGFDPDAHVDGATQQEIRFWAVDGGSDVTVVAPALLRTGWHAYSTWYLRDGETARPTFWECHAAIALHMPELVGLYEQLTDAVGGDLEARFLSHWCPPPLFGACSLAPAPEDVVLWRSYDFPIPMTDRVMLRTNWLGTAVMGMSDCVLGLLDGVNEHGLAVALAFGGRRVVGSGFGIGLVIRYVLQTCRTVAEAVAALSRIPVQMSYNIALLDESGATAIVRVSPDRPLVAAEGLTAANRPGPTEWPEHARFCGTVEREAALKELEGRSGADIRDAFMTAPIQRPSGVHAWGTVYCVGYDARARTAELAWPEQSWRLGLDRFREGSVGRHIWLAPRPTEHITTKPEVRKQPLFIL